MRIETLIKISPIIIAGISIVFSVLALFETKNNNKLVGEANKLSRQALDSVEENFIIEKRPYLNIEPIKFGNDNHYIVAARNDNKIKMQMRIEVYNSGFMPAKKIQILDFNALANEEFGKIDVEKPPLECEGMTLAAGDSVYMVVNMNLDLEKSDEQNIIKTLEEIKNNQFYIPLNVIISYTSDLDPLREHKTLKIFRVWTDRVNIIRSEMN